MRTLWRFLAVFFLISFASSCASATDQDDNPPPVVDQAPVAQSATQPQQTYFSSPEDPLGKIGPQTGTVVDMRVRQLLTQTAELRDSVRRHDAMLADTHNLDAAAAIQYHSSVAAIEARLQQGTTKGNPILLRQWDEALADLDQINGAISRLNSLSTDIDADGSVAEFLMQAVRAAYDLTGGIDEDHENLDVLKDVLGQMTVMIERMNNEVSNDLLRMNAYITAEHNNMQALAFAINKGEMFGDMLSNRPLIVVPPVSTSSPSSMVGEPEEHIQSMPAPPMPAPPMPAPPMSAPVAAPDDHASMPPSPPMPPQQQPQPQPPQAQPLPAPAPVASPQSDTGADSGQLQSDQLLLVIKFSSDDVNYDRQLYDAVSKELDRNPAAMFSLLAVVPQQGDSAQVASATVNADHYADAVRRSLTEMGMPAGRLSVATMGSPDATVPEVRVYTR